MFQVRWEGPSSDEGRVQRLPPIGASFNVAGRQVIQAQTQQDVQTEAEQVQSQHHQNQIHQQPLLLPRLLPLKKDGKKKTTHTTWQKMVRQKIHFPLRNLRLSTKTRLLLLYLYLTLFVFQKRELVKKAEEENKQEDNAVNKRRCGREEEEKEEDVPLRKDLCFCWSQEKVLYCLFLHLPAGDI